MKTIELKGTLRTELGKKATKQLRKLDQFPCVIYGSVDPVHFVADLKEYGHLVYTPHVYLAKITIDGTTYDAVVQDIQFHPVSDEILHIDFLQVVPEKPVRVSLPVKLEGFAKGVQQGGKLSLELRKLQVKGLVKHIPDHLVVDVTPLSVGQTVKVRDLAFEGLELLDQKNQVVATVKTTRAAKGTATGEGGEESGK
jgi:large subunit ribosomal protein L25